MLSWAIWNRTVFDIETVLMLNRILWNGTVWLNLIAWNRNVFDNENVYICLTKLFEIELFICIKMDLALNNQQRLIYNKTQTNKQINNWSYCQKCIK